ncbi:MAG: DUF1667 domain-containing protein [Christensenellales bacterium]
MNRIVCLCCPNGCELDVSEENGRIVVSGNNCKNGEIFALQEYTEPQRIVTTLIKNNGYIVAVKTDGTVPKDSVFGIVAAAKRVRLDGTVRIGDVVMSNVMKSGRDLIATTDSRRI